MSVTGTTFAASVGRGFLCCFSPISVACGAARPAVADYRSKFALDSPVEGDGFETFGSPTDPLPFSRQQSRLP